MIISKENLKEKLKKYNDETIYIVTDFDRTITKGTSTSSWSILSNNPNVPKEYVEKRQAYYDYYRPIETNELLDYEEKNKLMIEWWTKHINLFVEYKFKKNIIDNAINKKNIMEFRKGAKELLESLYKRKIPVIIISAGIGNFIEQFLEKNNCNFDNIYIISNFLKFDNGVAIGMRENIIHSLNKNEVNLPKNIKEKIKLRKNVILLGDNISDIKMINKEKRKEAFKIGFLEENIDENIDKYKENFDLICVNNKDFFELNDYLEKIGYKLI